MRKAMPAENIFIVANGEESCNLIFSQIKEIEKEFERSHILMEPDKKDTAPAIAFAVKSLQDNFGVSDDSSIIILPSDHHISNEGAYVEVVNKALDLVADNVGTIGITPTKPATGYGYIKKGELTKDGYYKAEKFKEKPDKEKAEEYLKSGDYVWNSGMYIFSPKTFKEEVEKYAPELSGAMKMDIRDFVSKFKDLTPISIDYAISEKSDKVIIFESDFGWNDVGSFDSLAEIMSTVAKTTKNPEKHVSEQSKDVFVHNETGQLVATVGIEDVVVVVTKDAILIQKKGSGEEVKKIAKELDK